MCLRASTICLSQPPIPVDKSAHALRLPFAPKKKEENAACQNAHNQRVLAQLAWFTPLAETGVSESRFLSLSSVYS